MKSETNERLDKQTLSSIKTFTSLSDKLRNDIKVIDNIKEKLSSTEIEELEMLNNTNNIIEYSLLLILVDLDLASAVRLYLNAKEKYEILYSTKQLIVTINESFKNIYHFILIDKNGNKILKNRNKSFWVKDILSIVNSKFTHLAIEHNNLTNELDSFIDKELEDMKVQRDLIVHYDSKPSKVYDMLIGLDSEKVSLKVISLMSTINKMIRFLTVIIDEYGFVNQNKMEIEYNHYLKLIEEMKLKFSDDPQQLLLLENMQGNLVKLKKS